MFVSQVCTRFMVQYTCSVHVPVHVFTSTGIRIHRYIYISNIDISFHMSVSTPVVQRYVRIHVCGDIYEYE